MGEDNAGIGGGPGHSGNLNLCAGFPTGIEGAVHLVQAACEQVRTPEEAPEQPRRVQDQERAGKNEAKLAEAMESPRLGTPTGGNNEPIPTVGGTRVAETNTRATAEPEAVLLVDARNGFNELSCKAMTGGSRFTFNCYRHAVILIIRLPGGEAETLL